VGVWHQISSWKFKYIRLSKLPSTYNLCFRVPMMRVLVFGTSEMLIHSQPWKPILIKFSHLIGTVMRCYWVEDRIQKFSFRNFNDSSFLNMLLYYFYLFQITFALCFFTILIFINFLSYLSSPDQGEDSKVKLLFLHVNWLKRKYR